MTNADRPNHPLVRLIGAIAIVGSVALATWMLVFAHTSGHDGGFGTAMYVFPTAAGPLLIPSVPASVLAILLALWGYSLVFGERPAERSR